MVIILKDKLRDIKEYAKTIFNRFKEDISKKENHKKYISIFAFIILLNILFINIFASNAYYEDTSFSLINAEVGNPNIENKDYVLLIYLEKTKGSSNYYLTNNIPSTGYTYSGYDCENGSQLEYNTSTKTTSVTISQKEICSIYFNLS